MKRFKKYFLAAMVLAVIAMLATGCSSKETVQTAGKKSAYPTNEVLSTKPYDAEKTTIVFSITDGLSGGDAMKAAIEEKFPQYNILMTRRLNTDLKIQSDYADVYMIGNSSVLQSTEEKLMDLSVLDSTSRYYATTLQSCASVFDGKQYLLPTPANVSGIVYNKTMFEENGWSVPHSRTEFVELCHTIQASGVVERAFIPALKFTGPTNKFAQLFNASGYFDTVAFLSWRKDYAESDQATIRPVLQQLYDTYKYFIDEGVIQVGDFTVRPPERSKMMYGGRSAAMTIETNRATQYAADSGVTDEYAMFPYYSGDEPGDDYVAVEPVVYLGVSKTVETDEAKLTAVTEILDFFATPEGQKVFTTNESMLPMLKNADVDYSQSAMMEGILDTVEAGRLIDTQSYFLANPIYSIQAMDCAINGLFHTGRMGTEIIDEDRAVTMDEAVAYLDDVNAQAKTMKGKELQTLYAVAKADFSLLETAEYMAAMYQNWAGADIGLCLCNVNTRGPMDAFPKGDLAVWSTPTGTVDLAVQMDWTTRGVVIDENDQKLVVYTMTGAQILQALENPAPGNGSPYFTASGLKIEYAPWAAQGSRYLKVTLADGSALEADKLYTVAAWNYTVDEQYVTEKVKIYEDKFQDMLRTQLTKDKEIAPFDDGRFVLNWDVRSDT